MFAIINQPYGRPMEPSVIDDLPLKIGRASKFLRPTIDFQGKNCQFQGGNGVVSKVFLKCLCILILGEMILEWFAQPPPKSFIPT